jgi:hypothetical protein
MKQQSQTHFHFRSSCVYEGGGIVLKGLKSMFSFLFSLCSVDVRKNGRREEEARTKSKKTYHIRFIPNHAIYARALGGIVDLAPFPL